MSDEFNREEEWKKLMATLFPRHAQQNPEAFVSRVMTRIEIESRPRPLFNLTWNLPAWGLAAVALVSLFLVRQSVSSVSTEALLIADKEESLVQLAFQNESPESDDVLAFALEEK